MLILAAPAWAQPAAGEKPDEAELRTLDALFSMAIWAEEQGLDEHVEQLHERILKRDANHKGVRRARHEVRFGERWVPAAEAMAICAAGVDEGEVDDRIEACLAELLALADSPAQQSRVRRLQAFAAMCRRQFDVAAARLIELAATAPADQRPRLEAAAELLAEHPDGLYLITEEHLVGAALLGDTEAALPPGLCSLADPTVLRIALRDKAGEAIFSGVRMLTEARQVRATDAKKAEKLSTDALGNFQWADAVSDGIARSYRIEAAQLRIGIIRERIEAGAVQFDAELTAIGRHDLTVDAYVTHLERMTECLRTVQADLDTILDLAAGHPAELAAAIRWAKADRRRIVRMQKTLAHELDEVRMQKTLAHELDEAR